MTEITTAPTFIDDELSIRFPRYTFKHVFMDRWDIFYSRDGFEAGKWFGSMRGTEKDVRQLCEALNDSTLEVIG